MNAKIISVSRRTDIPAFYTEWFMNGIKRGYVDSINPFNRKYVSRVSLKKEDVICFVFWSKNPKPLMNHLIELDNLGYSYYFQYTLNPYEKDIEKSLPPLEERIKTFQELSAKTSKEQVIWRYDPILLNAKYTIDFHLSAFRAMLKALSAYTNKVVFSFIDLYQKTKRNMNGLMELSESEQIRIASEFAKIADEYGVEISTCSEVIPLEAYGIKHNKCIDDDLVQKITDYKDFDFKKDKGQRKTCGCVESIDIGAPNTCRHFCNYCYANTSIKTVQKNSQLHNASSSLLSGKLYGDETIKWRNGQ